MTTTLGTPGGATGQDPGPVSPADPRATRRWWWVVLVGAAAGVVATVWQTVERLRYAAGDTDSFCDISATLSCSSVYTHWQSSALGIPNSLIGLPVFALIAGTALAALLGSRLSATHLRVVLGLALFMTAFVTWYLQQTAFSIGALCLFCVGCMVSISLAGAGLVRVADAEGALGKGRLAARVRAAVDSWVDLALWLGLGMLVAVMLVVGLAF